MFALRGKKAIFTLLTFIITAGCAALTEQLETTKQRLKSLNNDGTQEKSTAQATREQVTPKESPSPDFFIHTVAWTGESLSIIAKWYTGSLENWKTIAKVNPELNPSLVQVGMKIRIPEIMIVNRNPMPVEFVASHYSKDAKRSKSPPPEPSDPPLIGPKSYSDK